MNRFLKPPDRVLESFTTSEQGIYEYFINNIEEVGKSNITSISNVVYSSPATVFNLLKKLGYSGFKEFKFECLAYSNEIKSKLSQDDIKQEQFDKIIDFNSIIHTCKNQQVSEISEICTNIHEAKRVLVIANEITKFVADDFVYRLQLCSVDVVSSVDHKQYKVLLSKKIYDYVIVFSKFGNTEKIINAVEASDQVIDLLITTNSTCYLKDHSKKILLGKQSAEDNIIEELGDISSRISLFLLADFIISTYIYTYISKR